LIKFVIYYGCCHSLGGATLFFKVHSNTLRFSIKNKITLIYAKTKWPHFFRLPCIFVMCGFWQTVIVFACNSNAGRSAERTASCNR